MISETSLRQARYYPELHPDGRIQTIAANTLAESLVDLRNIRAQHGVAVRLVNVGLEQNATINARMSADDLQATDDVVTSAAAPNIVPMDLGLTAFNRLQFQLHNSSTIAAVANYRTQYGAWIWEPTVMEKMQVDQVLNEEEKALVEKFRLKDKVQRGSPYPLDIERIMRDQYKPWRFKRMRMFSVTHTLTGAANATIFGTQTTLAPDWFVVLAGFWATPGTFDVAGVNENVEIAVRRDDQGVMASFRTAPLAMAEENKLAIWIPATQKIELTVQTNVAIAARTMRALFIHYPLTLVHRIRWGMVSKDEVERRDPGLWDAVKAGLV